MSVEDKGKLLFPYFLIGFSLLILSPLVSDTIGYVLMTVVYLSWGGWILLGNQTLKVTKTQSVSALLLIAAAFGITQATTPSQGGIARTGAFVLFGFANLFVLPNYINKTHFFHSLAVISSLVTVASLPSVILNQHTLSGIGYSIRRARPVYPGIVPFKPIAGLLKTQNFIAFICAISIIWLLFNYQREEKQYLALAGICSVGLVLAASRAALLVTGVAVLGWFFDRLERGRVGIFVVFVLSLGVVFGTFVEAGLFPWIPDPGLVSLSNRSVVWATGIDLVKDSLLFGHGPATATDLLIQRSPAYLPDTGFHNSYIRVFAMAGLVGGFAYLWIIGDSIQKAVHSNTGMFALLMAIVVMQWFQTSTLFGFETRSIIASMVVGYALQSGSVRKGNCTEERG